MRSLCALRIQRILESSSSGRGFLQEHGPRLDTLPSHSNYFATLRSARRGRLLHDLSVSLIREADAVLPNRLAGIAELAGYECFAQDGHWHQAAVHDARHEGVKMAVGHFYSLNRRTHSLRHLAVGQRLHEHDMSVLKRCKPKGLCQEVPKGRRVLIVYDKAGIDFDCWKRCRHENAVYFLSRVKEAMVYDWLDSREWDRSDPRNHGIRWDRRGLTRDGHLMRPIGYIDPVGGEAFEFLSNRARSPRGGARGTLPAALGGREGV